MPCGCCGAPPDGAQKPQGNFQVRVFNVDGASITETSALPSGLPAQGFVWVSLARAELESNRASVQAMLQQLCGMQLVDLHVSDLLNIHLPSRYDYTSQYDMVVFRRLASGTGAEEGPGEPGTGAKAQGQALARRGTPILRRIDTSPVGFALFDRLVLTVHPADCMVREQFASRLLTATSPESRASGARLPGGPADLMLRFINLMVDGYLELRRELTRQLDHWQTALLDPRTRFNNWSAVLEARLSLHHLEEVCEDQRAAIQDWIEALETWPAAATPTAQRELDLLAVRSRDVLEHIERVASHVRRLEQSAETAVQMHFNAQSNRTNDIMRTLTVLTAIFLPLNLIAGIFGMNFDSIPLLHTASGFWLAMGSMLAVGLGLALLFWRKRYLARTAH
jgi:magnesium transporter